MEKETDLQIKYQRLATEFSKVRSQVTVLKKAVLEEQAKNAERTEALKRCEQTIRKRDQEMESLTFRNEQLTKRIVVLQQELQSNNNVNKKGKTKINEVSTSSSNTGTDVSILNEEFQKKILQNAQLIVSIEEKDMELMEYKDRVKNLEERVRCLENDLEDKEKSQAEQIEKYKKEIRELQSVGKNASKNQSESTKPNDISVENVTHWKAEAERWKTEWELLKSKPTSNDKLTTYYESQLSKILENNMVLQSETKSTWAENLALQVRLENITVECNELKNKLEKNQEEMITTSDNYKNQLDAMTEHLAAQNEKITRQCDEIQFLKHKLAQKK